MLPARHFSAVATASLLIAWGCFAAPATAQDTDASANCQDEAGLTMLASPASPWKGAPLRVIFTTEKKLDGELSLVAPDGKVAVQSADRHGGPPYFWFAEIKAPHAGKWQAKLVRDGASADCQTVTRDIEVKAKQPAGPRAVKAVWQAKQAWTREVENLYSAWIEKLFDAPLDEAPSWKALHEVLRDPGRNVLFDHLGLREDQKNLVIRPDCADLPYFLRAYFAFKMGLPFGYAKCNRGDGGKAPRCTQWWTIENEEPPPPPPEQRAASGFFGAEAAPAPRIPRRPQGLVPGFGHYMRTTIANGVHSGNGRTAFDDNDTDYYPVPLSEDALRPGTIYADPYGHLLVLVKRVPQTDEGAGVFLAVDGQPDGTVARKRFWRGNFLFAQDPALGGAGFKHARPVVRGKNGTLRRMTNAEIEEDADYGNFSLEQGEIDVEEFYDRMDDVMSPAPLEPMRAIIEAITALEEQVKARVNSVENGREYLVKGGRAVDMPDGASIFETSGPWEDFATPSRDLRLLIAIDVVRNFPDRVARRPERYAMPPGKSAADVKADLESTLDKELEARKFSYTRSDGSQWELTLADVLDRLTDLEMAYNVNDCPELRWGALEGSEEEATCKRRASNAQRAKMAGYRSWFSERRRPPRG